MKVQGMVNPGSFTVEEIPGTKRSLVRLYQNVEACKIAKDAEDKEGLDGFQYDEYCVEVESWPGLAASVDVYKRQTQGYSCTIPMQVR